MKIVETYSHLNGLEFLIVHQSSLWDEIRDVIKLVDAEACKTKISTKNKQDKVVEGRLLDLVYDFAKANGFHERVKIREQISEWCRLYVNHPQSKQPSPTAVESYWRSYDSMMKLGEWLNESTEHQIHGLGYKKADIKRALLNLKVLAREAGVDTGESDE